MDIDDRLDLDLYMKGIKNSFPDNDDDFILYMRGKASTKELASIYVGNTTDMANGLFSLLFQSNGFKEAILELLNMMSAMDEKKLNLIIKEIYNDNEL